MKLLNHNSLLAIALLFGACLPTATLAKTVNSLDEIESYIQEEAGKVDFAEQMKGEPIANGFGEDFNGNLTKSAVHKLLLPDVPASRATLTGLQRWPHAENTYIAFACAAPTKEEAKADLQHNNNIPICQPSEPSEGDSAYDIALTLMTTDGDAPSMVADVLRWKNREDDSPIMIDWYGEGADGQTLPSLLHHLDTANYALTDDVTAFAIRSNSYEGYAGGMAFLQYVTLFAAIDGKLQPVLSQPIYHFENLAGEWNDDGSRQHVLSESASVLIMTDHKTHGFRDIILKSKSGGSGTRFCWQPDEKYYQRCNQ